MLDEIKEQKKIKKFQEMFREPSMYTSFLNMIHCHLLMIYMDISIFTVI